MRHRNVLAVIFSCTVLSILATSSSVWGLPSFGEVRGIAPGGGTQIRATRGPRLVGLGTGVWISTWVSEDYYNGTVGFDYDVFFVRSVDDGETWSAVSPLNTDAATDETRDFDADVAVGSDGLIVAAWQRTSTGGVVIATSSDSGLSWTAPSAVGGPRGEDTRIFASGVGNWLIVWSSEVPAESKLYDLYYSRSVDNAATWSAPSVINSSQILCSDEPSFSIVGDGGGTWLATWDTCGGDIQAARSLDDASSWSPVGVVAAAQPTLAPGKPSVGTDGVGTWVVSYRAGQSATGRDLYSVRSIDSGDTWSAPLAARISQTTPGSAKVPQTFSAGAGHWYIVYTSSESLDKIRTDDDILVVASTDDAVSWSSPFALNTSANKDHFSAQAGADDSDVNIVSDGADRWLAVWRSSYRYPGAADEDPQVVFARSAELCQPNITIGCKATVKTRASKIQWKDHRLGRNALRWQWRGQETLTADFGDPALTSEYLVCMYDHVGAVPRLAYENLIPAAATCRGGDPCWSLKNSGEWRFSDKEFQHGAIRSVKLRPGADGKAKVAIKGDGSMLAVPQLPLAQAPNVVFELHNLETSACWSASFSVLGKNTDALFKAKSD